MKIKLIKFNDDFIYPQRAHYNDSGADVYSPIDTTIEPNTIKVIGLGFGVELPDGYDAVVHSKSGLSSKGLWSSNAPIDAGYRGELHVILYNASNDTITINKGMKIGQLVIRPVIYADFVDSLGNNRGENNFGSTGV